MSRSLPILEDARIASPCDKSWSAMAGDDRVRYCDACEKNVFNLVGMSDEDVTALILQKEGHLCVRLYQRRDGTLLTSDCPVGLRAARRKLARAVGAVAACLSFLMTAATFGRVGSMRLIEREPFLRLAKWVAPPSPPAILGTMIYVPPPSNGAPKRFVPPPTDGARIEVHEFELPKESE